MEGPRRVAQRPVDEEPCSICFDPINLGTGWDSQAASAEGSGGQQQGGVTFCAFGCGYNFHAECLNRWLAVRSAGDDDGGGGGGFGRRGKGECPRCRAPWDHRGGDSSSAMTGAAAGSDGSVDVEMMQQQQEEEEEEEAGAVLSEEGYLNLRAWQQETTNVRDESSYSSWLQYHKRRRR